MSLADLRPGQRARVRHVAGAGAIRQRLLDLGVLPDTAVEVARVAPAGGPVWIRLDGYELALRRREACTVAVEAA
jgi:Fe2+ transport system protein FeoA